MAQPHPPPALPPHIAVANHKGGVGKTSTTVGLAAAAAEDGERVLVVDMDPQGNSTRRLRAHLPDALEDRAAASLAGVLPSPARGEAARIVTPCGWSAPYSSRIDVLPSDLDLELLGLTAGLPSAERRLLRALATVVDAYDLVLIDCPPSLLSHLTDNAWTASDYLLVPCEAEFESVQAARRVSERITRDRHTLNPDLQIAGFVPTRYRAHLGVHRTRLEDMAKISGPEAICPTRFPELAAMKTSAEKALPLAECGSQGRDMAALFRDTHTWLRNRITHLEKSAA
ncbi:ParA family protein [Streptomyces sp. ADI98-10]|uniref:ParA family protein n=1 Tax=Streptomyces sp. ADI98-10 TaxID=1522763 RepID=UPI000F553649|nr:ParA family protein [Streptomyces sp. ADI98-10]RPK77819.1 Sporulation initiation inhibitor protein Soj [Streptomyces sp. ADI98-10]